MNNFRKTAILLLLAVAGFYACQESDRLTIGSDDGVAPNPPTVTGRLPLNGGVRFYYQIPSDKDLLSIDAEYTAANGDVRRFSASYFIDSLDVLGMTGEQTVRLYATDRAGNKSTVVSENVVPLKSPVLQVRDSISVVPGFNSVLVKWKNIVEPTPLVNVYVTLNYTSQGVGRETTVVLTSKRPSEQRFINLTDLTTVDVSVYVGDMYGNVSPTFDKPQLALQQDVVIPKTDWKLPNANDTIGGIPMVNGDMAEGSNRFVIDGIVDYGSMSRNYLNTGGVGRDGAGSPWDFIIDLGATYKLSRIVTHQRHLGNEANPELSRGNYYGQYNVGTYNMYVWTGAGDPSLSPWKWDETGWERIGEQRTIPIPVGNDAELSRQGHAGDEVIMYPDDPHYTQPTRWFRYEAIADFLGGRTHDCPSEITLYGIKQ
ncbi:hypothetical protein SAMD00024442_15_35 [Candidatus Symbiothrix dinenymphae]|nr:hypothetical protein SAMD00024442_15_35 [Candidatus Symbiothrix dinenymphae]